MIFEGKKRKIYRPSIRKCKLISRSVVLCDFATKHAQKKKKNIREIETFSTRAFKTSSLMWRARVWVEKSMEIILGVFFKRINMNKLTFLIGL